MIFKLSNVLLTELFIALASILSCFIASFYLLFTQGTFSLLYYGDSVSHMIISRRIFDSIIPGITQLGGVWLPMSHIMLAPFVANDLLFRHMCRYWRDKCADISYSPVQLQTSRTTCFSLISDESICHIYGDCSHDGSSIYDVLYAICMLLSKMV